MPFYYLDYGYFLGGVKKKKFSNRGRDRMVVGFTTTYAIIAYHH